MENVLEEMLLVRDCWASAVPLQGGGKTPVITLITAPVTNDSKEAYALVIKEKKRLFLMKSLERACLVQVMIRFTINILSPIKYMCGMNTGVKKRLLG